LDQLAGRLWDRMRLLQSRHSVPAHHQTLQAAFDWSYELCTDDESRMWAALSVFGDGFDLAAADEMCADAVPVARAFTALLGLVDKSVLSRERTGGQDRYRLLHTVREYGLLRLREHPGAEQALRRRYRDYYLRLAQRGETDWSGPRQEATYRCLRGEHAHLRAALEFCLVTPGQQRTGLELAGTLWFYWTGCGFLREGRHWLDRFLDADPEPSPQRTKALWALGAVAVAEGDRDTADRALTESRQRAAAAGDERLVGLAELSMGTLALFADDPAGAARLFEQGLARFDRLGEAARIWHLMGRRRFGSAALEAQHAGCEAHAREVLGDAGFDAAYHRGTRFEADEAVSYALGADPAQSAAAGDAPPVPAGLQQ